MAGRALNQLTLVGQKLGHYRIVEEIGAGGMGVVYCAHDEHLDREVAIKVLPSGTLCDESARKRFRKEARSLSKLNHPNVATVHDFDSHDGIDYLVMEYVPGKTLRDRISDGPLPQAEIIRLATQLAKGLTAAHERGLVHRDLKPENLRLTLEGRLKILDFGLAELIRPFPDLRTTDSNMSVVAGTVPYMAPEQVLGGVVDQRADLFSFGVVLYEMATGQHPFAELEPSHVAAAIVHRTPVPPTTLNTKVCAELQRIIFKCLEKEPEKRYQSAKDLAIDLRRTTLTAHTSGWSARRLRNPWVRNTAAVVLGLGVVLVIASLFFRTERVHALAPSDTIVLADFVNSTPDPVFNDALNQGLMVELEQSPFLKILPQAKVQDMLRLMGRSRDQSLTPEISREVCQRTAAKAVLWGPLLLSGRSM